MIAHSDSSLTEVDVVVVGSGIAGLAHAWVAQEAGCSVAILEKDHAATGASIRNFGMIWPIGQPPGPRFEMAMQSRHIWCDAARVCDFWLDDCGSVHLAHHADELQVLEEFCDSMQAPTQQCRMLTAREVQQLAPAANPVKLVGGMWSPSELAVDPPDAIYQLTRWMEEQPTVQIHRAAAVTRIGDGIAETASGARFRAPRIILANGSDFELLFPDVFAGSPLERCKLQMLKTKPQPANWRCGPHLAGGLTLRHYENFARCPSLERLKQRIASETPELDHFGIHVMASQNQRGEVILGDSHEYGDPVLPFRSEQIDTLMLRELKSLIQLKTWSISHRWSGAYARHPTASFFEHDPQPGVKIVTGLGGAGMTLSFGVAQDIWNRWTS